MTQPLIVLGMHRSGTSLLARILAERGLFIGRDVTKHAESLFFHALNQCMLCETGAAWDLPQPALAALRNRRTAERFAAKVAGQLRSLRTWRYLGSRFFTARGAIGPRLPFAWGFKDPRTALFLPVWLRVFPEARLLRIRRHGIDVAASLATRELARERPGPCAELANGLALWASYEDALDRAFAEVPAERRMTLQFEDYAAAFTTMQPRIEAFAMPVGCAAGESLRPDPARGFAYRLDSGLRDEAHRHADLLRARGYEP